MEAIRAADHSKKYFSGENDRSERNEYGYALACFQLGYLLSNYADKCFKYGKFDGNEDILYDKSPKDFRIQARDSFREAFSSFERRWHLKGMYMAK